MLRWRAEEAPAANTVCLAPFQTTESLGKATMAATLEVLSGGLAWFFSRPLFLRSWRELLSWGVFPGSCYSCLPCRCCSPLPLEWEVLTGQLIKAGSFTAAWDSRVVSQCVPSPAFPCSTSVTCSFWREGELGCQKSTSASLAAFPCCPVVWPSSSLPMALIALWSADLWAEPSFTNNYLAISAVTSGFYLCSPVNTLTQTRSSSPSCAGLRLKALAWLWRVVSSRCC